MKILLSLFSSVLFLCPALSQAESRPLKPHENLWIKAYCTGASNGVLYVVIDATPDTCVARVRECSGNPHANGQWLETTVSPPFKTCRRP